MPGITGVLKSYIRKYRIGFQFSITIQTDVAQLNPDILLMDIDMPGTNGIEGIRVAKAAKPSHRILMFTVFDDDKKIFDSICNGADGYLLKKTAPEK